MLTTTIGLEALFPPEVFAMSVEPVLLVLAAVGFGAVVTILVAVTANLGRRVTAGVRNEDEPIAA